MVPLPAATLKINVNSLKVAYACKTLDMIQAETFMAECAFRRCVASSLILENYMMKKREGLKLAQEAFLVLCLDYHPRRAFHYDHHPGTTYIPTSFPPNSDSDANIKDFPRG
jgi:hypothetical protein